MILLIRSSTGNLLIAISLSFTSAFTSIPTGSSLSPANEKEATEITVIVTVQADEKGDFAYNGKTLKFAIKATKVEVGNTTLDEFPITTFNFDMSKK